MRNHTRIGEIAMLDDQVSINEIAAAMNVTVQWARKMADRGNWQGLEINGRGERRYQIDQLPSDIQQAVIAHQVIQAHASAQPQAIVVRAAAKIAKAEQITPLPAPSTFTDWQRRSLDARCAILRLVDDLAEATNISRSVAKVVRMARFETLPAEIQKLVPIANSRAAGQHKLSKRTIYRWMEMRREGLSALAPKDMTPPPVPDWAEWFLKLYRQPQKPSVPDVLERLQDMLPEGIVMPSKMQCYRFLERMSAVDREKGRRTGNELRAIKSYRQRSTEGMIPLDVVTCDGHSFKAKVAHPDHGQPFQPEVCACLDVVTRKAIGWSAGLAESSDTVSDALRHGIQHAGIPLYFYTDNGAGNTAHINAHESFGRYARLNITFKTSIPGNAQARGLIERFQGVWIKAAKNLPTYKGKDMDGTTLFKRTRWLESDIKKKGCSDMLMSWEMFLQYIPVVIHEYNEHPHSSLPKITDETGRKRHMSPNEYWDWWVFNGWAPIAITEEELTDMWRPWKLRYVQRSKIQLFGNSYYHKDLEPYHGSQVYANYEPQDASFIYVRDLDGVMLCKAEWNGNRSSYMPIPEIEVKREQRYQNRMAANEKHRREIELERRGSMVIDIQPDPELIESRRQLEETMRLELAESNEPVFDESMPKGKWLKWKWIDGIRKEKGKIPIEHQAFYSAFQSDPYFGGFMDAERDLGGNNERNEDAGADLI